MAKSESLWKKVNRVLDLIINRENEKALRIVNGMAKTSRSSRLVKAAKAYVLIHNDRKEEAGLILEELVPGGKVTHLTKNGGAEILVKCFRWLGRDDMSTLILEHIHETEKASVDEEYFYQTIWTEDYEKMQDLSLAMWKKSNHLKYLCWYASSALIPVENVIGPMTKWQSDSMDGAIKECKDYYLKNVEENPHFIDGYQFLDLYLRLLLRSTKEYKDMLKVVNELKRRSPISKWTGGVNHDRYCRIMKELGEESELYEYLKGLYQRHATGHLLEQIISLRESESKAFLDSIATDHPLPSAIGHLYLIWKNGEDVITDDPTPYLINFMKLGLKKVNLIEIFTPFVRLMKGSVGEELSRCLSELEAGCTMSEINKEWLASKVTQHDLPGLIKHAEKCILKFVNRDESIPSIPWYQHLSTAVGLLLRAFLSESQQGNGGTDLLLLNAAQILHCALRNDPEQLGIRLAFANIYGRIGCGGNIFKLVKDIRLTDSEVGNYGYLIFPFLFTSGHYKDALKVAKNASAIIAYQQKMTMELVTKCFSIDEHEEVNQVLRFRKYLDMSLLPIYTDVEAVLLRYRSEKLSIGNFVELARTIINDKVLPEMCIPPFTDGRDLTLLQFFSPVTCTDTKTLKVNSFQAETELVRKRFALAKILTNVIIGGTSPGPLSTTIIGEIKEISKILKVGELLQDYQSESSIFGFLSELYRPFFEMKIPSRIYGLIEKLLSLLEENGNSFRNLDMKPLADITRCEMEILYGMIGAEIDNYKRTKGMRALQSLLGHINFVTEFIGFSSIIFSITSKATMTSEDDDRIEIIGIVSKIETQMRTFLDFFNRQARSNQHVDAPNCKNSLEKLKKAIKSLPTIHLEDIKSSIQNDISEQLDVMCKLITKTKEFLSNFESTFFL